MQGNIQKQNTGGKKSDANRDWKTELTTQKTKEMQENENIHSKQTKIQMENI